MKKQILWNWDTSKEIIKEHISKLHLDDELLISGFDKPTGGDEFGETIKDNLMSLLNFASSVIVEIPESINFDNQYEHTVNTLELNYKIKRLK